MKTSLTEKNAKKFCITHDINDMIKRVIITSDIVSVYNIQNEVNICCENKAIWRLIHNNNNFTL